MPVTCGRPLRDKFIAGSAGLPKGLFEESESAVDDGLYG